MDEAEEGLNNKNWSQMFPISATPSRGANQFMNTL